MAKFAELRKKKRIAMGQNAESSDDDEDLPHELECSEEHY